MKTLSFIAVLAAICTTSAAWHTETIKDEMTDDVSYIVATTSAVVRTEMGSMFIPYYAFRITPKTPGSTQLSVHTFLMLKSEFLKPSSDMLIRFDSQPARKLPFRTSGDAAIFTDGNTLLNDSLSATNILIRYTTLSDTVRTLRFNATGLAAELRTVCDRIRPRGAK
jgi:hypothetical protein